jgi:hypothetical protein
MRMPGFTARASLLQAEGGYHAADTFGQADGAVYPAYRYARCVSRCLQYNKYVPGREDFCAEYCAYLLEKPKPPVVF